MSSAATDTSVGLPHVPDGSVPTRLLVTVRERPDVGPRRPYRLVGTLECRPGRYEFAYVQPVSSDFVPLIGFPEPDRTYVSEEMFPLFAERIMSPRRPDRARYLEALDLGPESEPWEILVRSGGRRAGDTIEVLPEPSFDRDGHTSCVFLVHGVGYRGHEASVAISELDQGQALRLRWDETNPVNPQAILVLGDADVELGYVPDPLVEYVHGVIEGGDYALSVVRANGPEVGPHLRLLVRLDGRVSYSKAASGPLARLRKVFTRQPAGR